MENAPVIIGRYRLSKTLGIGAFGKVKCESKIALIRSTQSEVVGKGKRNETELLESNEARAFDGIPGRAVEGQADTSAG